MPGHCLTKAGGVIFVDVRGGWWIDFLVGSDKEIDL
jgi:hypothetical protein